MPVTQKQPLCFRCWWKASDQRGEIYEEEKTFVKLSFPIWFCCFVPVTEPTATLVWEPFDEFKFSDPPVTKVHSRFEYCLSEAFPWDPWKTCEKESGFLFFLFFHLPQSRLPSILSSLLKWQHRSSSPWCCIPLARKHRGKKSNANRDRGHSFQQKKNKKWLSASYVPGTEMLGIQLLTKWLYYSHEACIEWGIQMLNK